MNNGLVGFLADGLIDLSVNRFESEIFDMDIPSLKKVELHCHIDGIGHPELLRELQQRGWAVGVPPEVLAGAYPVHDFDSFVHWMETAEGLEGSLSGFLPLLQLHLERLRQQNVVYTEIMIGSSELHPDKAQMMAEFQHFKSQIRDMSQGEIQVEFLQAFARQISPERLKNLSERILMLFEAGLIRGIAIAGPEKGHPLKPHHRTLARLHAAGVPIEIHAGEWCGPESVREALEYGFPDRIGHGVAVFQDQELLKSVQDRQIHLEICLTSNLKTGSVAHLHEHPVRQARELGLNFSINTDDPGAFECSMNSEYQLLADHFGFQAADFERVYQNSLQARFGK